MLEGLKRLFSSAPAAPAQQGWDGIAPWAESKQYAFRGVQAEGFVIDGCMGAAPWRLEWGPSQRPYIEGQELRIRAELGLPSDLQVVLMDHRLQDAMEKAVFDQYVEGVQTRIDNQTPPEMRWLVMFPKLAGSEMPMLRDRFVALASIKRWLLRWLEGALTQSLASVRLAPDTPLGLDDRPRPPDAAHGLARRRRRPAAELAARVRGGDARSTPRGRRERRRQRRCAVADHGAEPVVDERVAGRRARRQDITPAAPFHR